MPTDEEVEAAAKAYCVYLKVNPLLPYGISDKKLWEMRTDEMKVALEAAEAIRRGEPVRDVLINSYGLPYFAEAAAPAARSCPRCGNETASPEGSQDCPEYFGHTGDGYCPLFVDGHTREEQAKIGYNGGRPPA